MPPEEAPIHPKATMRAAEQGRGPVRRRPVLVWLAALCVVCASLWGALLLWFQGPGTDGLRIALAAAWCLLGLGAARVATALNGNFLPAATRATATLKDGDALEVVAPMQGG